MYFYSEYACDNHVISNRIVTVNQKSEIELLTVVN